MTTGINLLDIAIPIILLLYFLAGVRSGFFTTLGTFLGLGLGVCAAAWLVPLAVASVGSQWSLITAVGVLIICLTIGQWLGLVAGRTIRRVTDITPLKGVERFFGGVLSPGYGGAVPGFWDRVSASSHRTACGGGCLFVMRVSACLVPIKLHT